MKKIRKAAGRKEFSEARRRDDLKPDMTIDHLVKERYPRFVDALRDLDDALCMVHMFASLPSQGRVTAARTSACQELAMHWQYYIAKSRTLRKTFISVKGVYFQAEILGEAITWLTPHQFAQAFPKDIDFRVMLTFLEFYEVFLKFTMFKLYNLKGLQYPPVVDKSLLDAGCYLLSVRSTTIESDSSARLPIMTVEKDAAPAAPTGKKKKNLSSLAKIASLEDKFESILEQSNHIDGAQQGDEEDGSEDMEVGLAAPLNNAFSDLHGDDEYEGSISHPSLIQLEDSLMLC